jgi:hypothetical protein
MTTSVSVFEGDTERPGFLTVEEEHSVSRHVLAPQVVAQLFADADRLAVPIMPSNGAMGLDGITYELSLSFEWMQATYRWWGNVPESWLALEALGKRLLEIAAPYLRRSITDPW